MASYHIETFIDEAKRILAGAETLTEKKQRLCERLQVLAQRDDLDRFGIPLEPTDASSGGYVLWNEPPHYVLFLVKFDRGYSSPVHEHGNFWVCACCWRGRDRWDMYERLDGGEGAGHAELRLIDRIELPPGRSAWMPAPPRAIHAHNNEADSDTFELIFSAAMPENLSRRLLYNVENRTARQTWFDGRGHIGRSYNGPTPTLQRVACAGCSALRLLSGGLRLRPMPA